MLGEVPHFLLREQVGNHCIFPPIQHSMPTANETPSWLPKLRGFGQWIRVGWPSLGRRLGGGPKSSFRPPSEKRNGDYTEIDVKSKTFLLQFCEKIFCVFFVAAVFDSS